jgi:hypothetical protein
METNLPSDTDMLALIKAFCAKHEIKDTTFGRRAVGDPNLIANLRAGRSLTLRTANAVVDFMSAQQADEAA